MSKNMNLIICGENCVNQKDGYCRMEGHSQITNALASPCCYFSEKKTAKGKGKGENLKK